MTGEFKRATEAHGLPEALFEAIGELGEAANAVLRQVLDLYPQNRRSIMAAIAQGRAQIRVEMTQLPITMRVVLIEPEKTPQETELAAWRLPAGGTIGGSA